MWLGSTTNTICPSVLFIWTISGLDLISFGLSLFCVQKAHLILRPWVNVSVLTPIHSVTGRWITVTGFLQADMSDFSRVLINALMLSSNSIFLFLWCSIKSFKVVALCSQEVQIWSSWTCWHQQPWGNAVESCEEILFSITCIHDCECQWDEPEKCVCTQWPWCSLQLL